MQFNTEWKDYKIISTQNGYKLESYAGIKLLRPDPQVIWNTNKNYNFENSKDIHAYYKRDKNGGGEWFYNKSVPDNFKIHWRNLVFSLKLMGFKHTGVFPEQAVNWAKMIDLICNADKPIKVLNLFAYTGGATIACASAGASVCHVDSAKSMCERAGMNAKLSGLSNSCIRYIIDDCFKFVEREINRGHKYDAVIMDPPSYGRGPRGEIWKITDGLFELVSRTKLLMSENRLFYLINSYTTGLQPSVMSNILKIVFDSYKNLEAYEIGVMTEERDIILPCGASALMSF